VFVLLEYLSGGGGRRIQQKREKNATFTTETNQNILNIMKKTLYTALVALLAITACGQNKKDMKTLVAYFSATGTTEAVAKDLAKVAGATLYEIKPEVKYTEADLDWRDKQSRSTLEMQDKSSRPTIVKDLEDADSYDVIYIGFPIWWYTAPTIINTFIEAYGFDGKTVIFFATSGGSDVSGADKQFHAQYPDINWKAGKLLNNASKKTLQDWVTSNR
jgi:flavodoxin